MFLRHQFCVLTEKSYDIWIYTNLCCFPLICCNLSKLHNWPNNWCCKKKQNFLYSLSLYLFLWNHLEQIKKSFWNLSDLTHSFLPFCFFFLYIFALLSQILVLFLFIYTSSKCSIFVNLSFSFPKLLTVTLNHTFHIYSRRYLISFSASLCSIWLPPLVSALHPSHIKPSVSHPSGWPVKTPSSSQPVYITVDLKPPQFWHIPLHLNAH